MARHLGADSTIATYQSLLDAHIYPAFANRKIKSVRREDIKRLVATMRQKGLGASRTRGAHLVVGRSSTRPSATG